MLYVIELGFYQDVPDLDLDSYASGTIERLPSHLYDAHNKKNYWLGLFLEVFLFLPLVSNTWSILVGRTLVRVHSLTQRTYYFPLICKWQLEMCRKW